MSRPIKSRGMIFVAALAAAATVNGQQIDPNSLTPGESVRQGSISQRRPGRFVQSAINRHRDFANAAFRGDQGEPVAEEESSPTFYEAILIDVLVEFFDRIQLVLFGAQLLGDLSNTLADLFSMTDATADDASARETLQSDPPLDAATSDPLVEAFRNRR